MKTKNAMNILFGAVRKTTGAVSALCTGSAKKARQCVVQMFFGKDDNEIPVPSSVLVAGFNEEAEYLKRRRAECIALLGDRWVGQSRGDLRQLHHDIEARLRGEAQRA